MREGMQREREVMVGGLTFRLHSLLPSGSCGELEKVVPTISDLYSTIIPVTDANFAQYLRPTRRSWRLRVEQLWSTDQMWWDYFL